MGWCLLSSQPDEKIRKTALLAARLMQEKRARDVVLLRTGQISVIADYFLIGTGITAIQLHAICDHLRRGLKEAGCLLLRLEGYREGWWVLMDYGSVVIHLFQPEARALYHLERLWGKAPLVDIESSG